MIGWLFLVLAIGAIAMMTNIAYRRRQIVREWANDVESAERLVDVGVTLHVVRANPAGDVLSPGGRPMVILRTYNFGGVIDTKCEPPRLLDPDTDGDDAISKKPRTWYCSEDQESIILHADDLPLGQLVIGSEGAGKTTALVIWHYLRWLEHIGERREGGQTAPVLKRLGLVKDEFIKLWSPSWGYYVQRDDFEGFILCDGTRIRFQHTHRQSAAQGSPIQGFNWSWCGRDEFQDQIDVHHDIESRGRAARDGRYKQLATATAKDDPEWRTLRDSLIAGGQWRMVKLLVAQSPFVAENFLVIKRASGFTDREFRRRFLAEDLPPESRVYFNWSREKNLVPVPRIGARRITSIVLRRKTNNPLHDLLIGNDPGTAKAGSIFLDAYELKGVALPCWWVRFELFTLHKTTDEHARKALEIARERFGVNMRKDGECAHVRSQPVGQAEDRPDLNVYRIWQRIGFDIKAAQYAKNGTGTGQIKKDSRIEMINLLLGDESNVPRLFIDVDELGKPVAPKLVEAFETMERDHRGRAEHEEKDENDPSDCPAALGYALWPWEKEAATELRKEIRKGMTNGAS